MTFDDLMRMHKASSDEYEACLWFWLSMRMLTSKKASEESRRLNNGNA